MSEKQKEQVRELMTLCTAFHKHWLADGSRLHVYADPHGVDFYKCKGHTQAVLGRLQVVSPCEPRQSPSIDGFFNNYAGEFDQSPNCIGLTADSPLEAFEKMSNCLAPLLEVGLWEVK